MLGYRLVSGVRGAVLAVLLGGCGALWAESGPAGGTGAGDRQQTKERHRWSLSDWLETRDRMRLMDLWLAMHSPSPYEFYLGGAFKTGAGNGGARHEGWEFSAAAYAYLFGVEAQYHTGPLDARWLALGNLRVFGVYNQATNLTLQGGVLRQYVNGVPATNPVAGAHLTLYLARAFGVTGLWRMAFASDSGLANPGSRWEAGGFIDFKQVRVYLDYVAESGGDPTREFGVLRLGSRVYF